jgi:hypothetical protein
MRLRWPRACGRLYGARATGGSMTRRSGQIGRLHESPDPLGERCAIVMREALAALGTPAQHATGRENVHFRRNLAVPKRPDEGPESGPTRRGRWSDLSPIQPASRRCRCGSPRIYRAPFPRASLAGTSYHHPVDTLHSGWVPRLAGPPRMRLHRGGQPRCAPACITT